MVLKKLLCFLLLACASFSAESITVKELVGLSYRVDVTQKESYLFSFQDNGTGVAVIDRVQEPIKWGITHDGLLYILINKQGKNRDIEIMIQRTQKKQLTPCEDVNLVVGSGKIGALSLFNKSATMCYPSR